MASLDHLFDLSEKRVVLIGGGGLLGTAMARGLVANGAHVAVVDRDRERATAAAADLDAFRPGSALAFHTDTTSKQELTALAEAVTRAWGPANVLVNNVMAKQDSYFDRFEDYPLEEWNYVMGHVVTGAMLACQVFGGGMAERGEGSIINTLSIYGIMGPDQRIYEGSWYEGRAINTPAVYSTSKAAVWGLTKYLACYWGDRGVRVNAVTPGGVFSGQNDTFVARYSARVPMGRMGERAEMAGAVAYLASDASSYVTGQNLVVDGGLSAW